MFSLLGVFLVVLRNYCLSTSQSGFQGIYNTYWDQIKHEKRPAGATQMSYCKLINNGLVTFQEWLKQQCKEDVALLNGLNLNTASPYAHLSHHLPLATDVPSPLPPTTMPPQAHNAYDLPSVSALVQFNHASTVNPVPFCSHQSRKLCHLPWPYPPQCHETLSLL